MIKKVISLMLISCMLISLNATSFASEAGRDDGFVESNSNVKISRDQIQKIYKEQGKVIPKRTIKMASSKNGKSDKEILLENINKIQELSQQKAINDNDQKAIVDEIDRLYKEINSLESVVELKIKEDSDGIGVRGGPKPNVPTDTRYLKSYGITSYTSYGGKDYQVYEVVVYTDDIEHSNKNPLLYLDSIDLLDDGNYTRSDFFEDVVCTSSYVTSLIDIPYALFSTVVPPSSYFGSSTSQSLKYEYTASQIFVYAYVAEKNVDWFEHMQTSERLSVTSEITAKVNKYGTVYSDTENCGTQIIESKKYADVNEPTKRYHNGYLNYEKYKVGDLKVYFDNDYKGKINTYYYSTVWSIPGL